MFLVFWAALSFADTQFEPGKEKILNYTSLDSIFNAVIYSPIYPVRFSINAKAIFRIQNLPPERLWINIVDILVTPEQDCRAVPYTFRSSAASAVEFVTGCNDQFRTLNRIVTEINDLQIVLPPQSNSPPFRINITSKYRSYYVYTSSMVFW